MDQFIELMNRLPVGTNISKIDEENFRLEVPETPQNERDILIDEDPITLLEKALEGRES